MSLVYYSLVAVGGHGAISHNLKLKIATFDRTFPNREPIG